MPCNNNCSNGCTCNNNCNRNCGCGDVPRSFFINTNGTGQRGPIGPTGPTGPTGPSNPNQIPTWLFPGVCRGTEYFV